MAWCTDNFSVILQISNKTVVATSSMPTFVQTDRQNCLFILSVARSDHVIYGRAMLLLYHVQRQQMCTSHCWLCVWSISDGRVVQVRFIADEYWAARITNDNNNNEATINIYRSFVTFWTVDSNEL